jgi:PPIC-type PPIASE domain
MRFLYLLVLVAAGAAYGQTQPASGIPTTEPAEKSRIIPTDKAGEARVDLTTAVITVDGFCPDAARGETCKTVVTRAQFEELAEALQPDMSLSLRLKVANAYARNMRMAAVAEKRGLDRTAAFEQEMRYARLQLLAQDLNRALLAEANNITDADVEKFYKQNKPSYQQAVMARIFIPHAKRITNNPLTDAVKNLDEETMQKTAEEAMIKVAASLRERAVNGEDPDKLQMDAYAEAGIKRTAVNTKMENVRRSTLTPQHETVMDLKPGEISEVFSDPNGAHFIYKMISKQTLTLDEAKSEIRGQISRQRYQESMKSFEGNVVLNDAYFIPPGKPVPSEERDRRLRRKKATAQSGQEHD